MEERIGDRYQEETKYSPESLSGGGLDWASKPDIYKEYNEAKRIKLPAPGPVKSPSFHDLILTRKSVRTFTGEPLSMAHLSYLLWAADGLQREWRGHQFRTVPSAGALYPIETYVVANDVEDLARGVYHYAIRDHHLEELKTGSFGDDITAAALGQKMCARAAAVFVWTAIFQRSKWKYRQRAYRYIYLDAGHIGQNFALAACSLELGTCQIGAFFDDIANEIIGIDGKGESTIYLSVVGHPG